MYLVFWRQWDHDAVSRPLTEAQARKLSQALWAQWGRKPLVVSI